MKFTVGKTEPNYVKQTPLSVLTNDFLALLFLIRSQRGGKKKLKVPG